MPIAPYLETSQNVAVCAEILSVILGSYQPRMAVALIENSIYPAILSTQRTVAMAAPGKLNAIVLDRIFCMLVLKQYELKPSPEAC